MKRKLCCFVLVLVAVFICSFNSALAAADIPVTFYAEVLHDLDLLLGYNGDLNLEGNVTRAQGAVMLIRLLGKEKEALAQNYTHPFADVPRWVSPYIGFCYKKGITKGISKTKYGPDQIMAQEQYATFVLRALGYNEQEGDFTLATALQKAAEIGLLSVNEAEALSSSAGFSREKMAFISYKALFAKVKDKDIKLLERLLNESAIDKKVVGKLGLLETVKCRINNKPYTDILQPSQYGRTLYNIADLFKISGWKTVAEGKIITLTKGGQSLVLTAGETSFTYNNEKYSLGVPLTYTNNKLYAPFELFNHVLGARIIFSERSGTYRLSINNEVEITYKGKNDLKARIADALDARVDRVIVDTLDNSLDYAVLSGLIKDILSEKCIDFQSVQYKIIREGRKTTYICTINYSYEEHSSPRESQLIDESVVVQVDNENELIKLIADNINSLNYEAFYFQPTGSYSGFSYGQLAKIVQKAQKYAAFDLTSSCWYSQMGDTFSLDFEMSFPRIEGRYIYSRINNFADAIIKNLLRPGMYELEIVKALHDYLIRNARYDTHNYYRDTIAPVSYNPYGTLELGIGVCESYSRAMKVLLDKIGLESELVSGANHMWNIIKIGNKYRHFDLTWDDPVPDRGEKVEYTFFNLTDAQMRKTHSWDSTMYPACS
ncbi:MAG: hypothetical protein GX200_04175 [Firmicutes bacterium]|nr:hypothetical protein [Bacillota bacterium]